MKGDWEQSHFGVWHLNEKGTSRGRGRVGTPVCSKRRWKASKEQQQCYLKLARHSPCLFPPPCVLRDKGGPLEKLPFSFCFSSTSPALLKREV